MHVIKNTALTYLSCSQNQLTNLNVTKNTALTGLDCYYNQLTNLDVSKNTALTDLRCYNNQLKFSTLPKGTYTTFAYVPQDTLQGGSAGYSRIIDLSSENNIAGNVSTYSWYDGASEIMANKYVNTNGKFLFTDGTYINKTLICKITNAKFPSLTLIYKVKLIPEEYHTADKTALRNFLIQNSADTLKTNGEKLNLGPAELEILKTAADWKTNESWVSKVAALEWNTEIPKKITLMFWNNRNFAGNLDVSGCDSLKRLSCFSNQLTNLDISKNIALTGLYCNSNQLTNLDVSKNTALTDLECIDNKLTNLDVTKNTALKRLHCSNNQLKFSTLPKGTYTTFIYAPQDTLQGSSIKIGSEIDLSSEYSIASNITTYKWFDGDTEIPAAEYTAANGKFTFSNASFLNKTLTCQMTNATFPDFDTKPLIYQVKITDGTGIAETGNSEIQLAIYPNPTTGELKIVTHNPLKGANELGKSPLGDLGVQLFDLTGKQVFETRKTEFNIGHLPNGLYLLKATTDKGVVNRKIVKE